MVSLQGHLGRMENGTFFELVTKVMYFDVVKLPWDLQRTVISYLESVDRLAGSGLKAEFFDPLDEDGDGVLHYEEAGKRGTAGAVLAQVGMSSSLTGAKKLGFLAGPFAMAARRLKWSRPEWNVDGHDIFKDAFFSGICWTAFRMSQSETESPDPSLPGLVWGKGKWPSYETARHMLLGGALYGGRYPNRVMFPGLYSMAFRYADMTQNDGRYTGNMISRPDPEALERYLSNAVEGRDAPLDFILYVPGGFDTINGSKLPNTETTSDPALILTAHFSGGEEVWPVVIPGA